VELAKNLTRICKERHLSLAALARLSGVKQPTLHGWTTGRTVHNLDDLKKVCSTLKVGVHEILFSGPDPFEMEDFIEEFIWGNVRIILQKTRKE
jgi:transcriptional regulator with XRE-family HTH domain